MAMCTFFRITLNLIYWRSYMTFKVDGWVRKIQVDVELHRTVTSNSNSKKKKKFN